MSLGLPDSSPASHQVNIAVSLGLPWKSFSRVASSPHHFAILAVSLSVGHASHTCLIPKHIFSLYHEACIDTCGLQVYSPSDLNNKTHLFSFLQPVSAPLVGSEWQEQRIQSFPPPAGMSASHSRHCTDECCRKCLRCIQGISSAFLLLLRKNENRQKRSFLQRSARNWMRKRAL